MGGGDKKWRIKAEAHSPSKLGEKCILGKYSEKPLLALQIKPALDLTPGGLEDGGWSDLVYI